MDSILDSVKKNLNLAADYTVFDPDVILFINSVFATLNELGLGPAEGFAIEDNAATWDDYLAGDLRLNSVKTYIYLRVRMLFDPPTIGYLVDALEKQVKELEWRLNVVREADAWVPGVPPTTPTYPDCW